MIEDKDMVHVRLPVALIRRIDHLAVDADLYRAGAIQELLLWAVDRAEKLGGIPEPESVRR